jgi:hypothetical protein
MRLRTGAALRLLGVTATLVLGGCSGDPGDGLEKFPVRGAVLVNGVPAPRMVVNFHALDPGTGGNAASPVARCDDSGRFELSTNADRDGAVAGRYAVTFFWPSDEGAMPTDRLDGRFSRPEGSPFRVEVERKANELEPFRVELDPKALAPAKDGPAALR